MTEYEVLDLIFESLPEGVEVDLYSDRHDLPRPEMYIKFESGECWQITAEPHPHPKEETQ